MWKQRRHLNEERERWEGAIAGGQLSEEARRKAVETRVHALLLKFRHMEEDISRQQKAEAVNFLSVLSILPQVCMGAHSHMMFTAVYAFLGFTNTLRKWTFL